MSNKYWKGRLYHLWINMKQRCYNPKNQNYRNYGGRGIIVCSDWLGWGVGYKNFEKWAYNNGYKNNLTIDRIDVNGNYEPSNCRWIEKKEQNLNKRNTYYVDFNGTKITLKELSDKLGINYFTLHNRLKPENINNYSKKELFSVRKLGISGEQYIHYNKSTKHYHIRVNGKYCGCAKDIEKAKEIRDSACRKAKELFLGEKE